MPKYLTQEWLDECLRLAGELPERQGASARMQYLVEAEDGMIGYYWVFEDGRLVSASLGELSDPDFTLTLSYRDSVSIQRGELDPNTAFRNGRIAFAGSMPKLMGLLPILWPPRQARRSTSAARYQAFREQLQEVTEY